MSSEQQSNDDEWITVTNVKISSGRIIIPMPTIDRHGVGREGHVLDMIIHHGNGDPVFVSDVPVTSQRRVHVPHHQRVIHNLDEKTVDIQIRDTGERYSG